jgi:hypothetical protein
LYDDQQTDKITIIIVKKIKNVSEKKSNWNIAAKKTAEIQVFLKHTTGVVPSGLAGRSSVFL